MLLRAFLIYLAPSFGAAWAGTQQVWLIWDEPAPEMNVVEYHVFYGIHGSYTNEDVTYNYPGDLIYGLDAGTNYFFAVKAVDVDGHVSPLSTEISITIPVPKPVPLKTEVYSDGEGVAYGMGVFGSWNSPTDWELDYSTDLQNWYPWQYGHGTDFWTYADFSWGDQFYFRLALF